MKQTTALAKLRRLLGNKLAYRVDGKAATADARSAAQQAARQLAGQRQAAQELLDQRRAAVLAADEEYQRLKQLVRSLSTEHARLRSIVLSSPITVGVMDHGFLNVKAVGDTWAEVVDKVTGNHT